MRFPDLKSLLPVACWLLAGSAFASQGSGGAAKRLYVQRFATKSGADKLREDVIAELRN
jgi:hypothetical protein